ncbi:hypothetical protein ACVW00_002046 [Marmoricola sp. URHA0025 HA25]
MSRHRIAAVVVATTFAVSGCGSADQAPSAADQVPHLDVILHRIDAALVDHKFAAARQDLHALKAAVLKARDAGELQDDDAARVLSAANELTAMLPAPVATPSTTPSGYETSPSTTASRPSRTKSAKPHVEPSTIPTGTPTTTPTSSPTGSASPSASPTSGVTREASPTGSPTSP